MGSSYGHVVAGGGVGTGRESHFCLNLSDGFGCVVQLYPAN